MQRNGVLLQRHYRYGKFVPIGLKNCFDALKPPLTAGVWFVNYLPALKII